MAYATLAASSAIPGDIVAREDLGNLQKNKCINYPAGVGMLYLPQGARCTLWAETGCRNGAPRSVAGIRVAFNTATNPVAHDKGIDAIRSIRCR